jgi:hypothetical protein
MKKHKFTWEWFNGWPKYTLDGKPFWALINPRIWARVTDAHRGEIEITEDELLGD